LTFLAGAAPEAERTFRTHWLSPDTPDAAREKLIEQHAEAPDLTVFLPRREWTCAECAGSGDMLTMDGTDALCLDCADLGHLVFLPAGDAALTRRAKKASGLHAVVLRWATARKRYERQGLLVEEAALAQAEEQCLADAEVRARRRDREHERQHRLDVTFQSQLAREIRRLFPGCPPERAEAVARHTATRGSGRVGRSAAGRALDEQAITLAVAASVRHADTRYDELLMSGTPRAQARARIGPEVEAILARWRSGR